MDFRYVVDYTAGFTSALFLPCLPYYPPLHIPRRLHIWDYPPSRTRIIVPSDTPQALTKSWMNVEATRAPSPAREPP
jgi:hypothetical protein